MLLQRHGETRTEKDVKTQASDKREVFTISLAAILMTGECLI